MDAGKPVVDRPINVIVADEQPVVRYGIRTVLERESGEFQVVAEVAEISTMIGEVREQQPDLLTLDLTMPGGSGVEALRSCIIAHPTLAVTVLTMQRDPACARQALRAGARSYMLKEAELAELLKAFRMAVAGESYLDARLGAAMATGGKDAASDAALSQRECEVVRLIAEGFVNREIAEQLGIGERTVKGHRAHAAEKLGFSGRSRSELTAYARRAGLVG
jgi:two-component system, NarL family, response regulator NreC